MSFQILSQSFWSARRHQRSEVPYLCGIGHTATCAVNVAMHWWQLVDNTAYKYLFDSLHQSVNAKYAWKAADTISSSGLTKSMAFSSVRGMCCTVPSFSRLLEAFIVGRSAA